MTRSTPLARLVVVLAAIVAALTGPGFVGRAFADDAPTAVSIKGTGLPQAITVRAKDDQALFNALLRQVSGLATQAGDPISPDPTKLGPMYTFTVFVGNAASQVYDLYPQAPGGPRAHRPAAQPKGQVADAWFYASVAMPDMLSAAGVPLARPSASGPDSGLAYGDPVGFVPIGAATTQASLGLKHALHETERTLLLWLVTPFVVLMLLFLAARRARRYGR